MEYYYLFHWFINKITSKYRLLWQWRNWVKKTSGTRGNNLFAKVKSMRGSVNTILLYVHKVIKD